MTNTEYRMIKSMLRFNRTCFGLTLLLFALEAGIALFVHDDFVRPYVGDFLVVILIYCFIKSFLNLPVMQLALAVLLLSFVVETLQYFHFINWLGLSESALARAVLGNSFAWEDLITYIAGIVTVILAERLVHKKLK